jgi:hypothetical protein
VDVAMEKVKAAVVGKPKSKAWLTKRRAQETLQLLHAELQKHKCNDVYKNCNSAEMMLAKLSLVAKMKLEHGFVWNETGGWGGLNWKAKSVGALQRYILLGK